MRRRLQLLTYRSRIIRDLASPIGNSYDRSLWNEEHSFDDEVALCESVRKDKAKTRSLVLEHSET